jgi:hypothetical protein
MPTTTSVADKTLPSACTGLVRDANGDRARGAVFVIGAPLRLDFGRLSWRDRGQD